MTVVNRKGLLTTEQVSIATASVTIKALQVNNKQMTQAVFKQLHDAPLIDENGPSLRGFVWGYVNYHQAKESQYLCDRYDAEIRPFVFQVGTSLRRCLVPMRRSAEFRLGVVELPVPVQYGFNDLNDDHDFLFYAEILEGWRPNRVKSEYGSYGYFWKKLYTIPGIRYQMEAEIKSGSQGTPHLGWLIEGQKPTFLRDDQSKEGEQNKCVDWLRKQLADCYGGEVPSSTTIREEIDRIVARMRAYFERWDAMIDDLESYEQLFIAV